MIKNILLLTKINFASIFKNMFNFGSKNKVQTPKNKILTIIGVSLFILLMLFSFGSMYYPMAMELSKVGATSYIFIYAGMQSTILLVIFSIFESSSYIFKTKDFEQLSSLPLKNSEIVVSKYLAMLLTSYVYSALLFLPAIIIYFIFEKITIIALLLNILGFAIFPLLASAIGCFLGFLVALITSRVKRANLITLIVTFVLFAGIMVFSFKMGDVITAIMQNGNEYIAALSYIMPTVAFYIKGIVNADFVNILIYVLIQILPTILVMIVLTLTFKRVNQYFLKNKALVSLKKIEYKTTSNFFALTKIEIKKVFNTPVWALNSLFGTMFFILIPILLRFNALSLSGVGELSNLSGLTSTVIILGFALIASMSITTCSSVSFESKTLWLTKGLPINVNNVFLSKICCNVILVAPFIIVGALLSLILFNTFSLLEMLLIFIVPLLSLITCSTLGLLINLCFPKTHYDNATQVAKQSLAVLLSMMGGMCVHILIFVVIFGILSNVSIIMASLIFIAIYLLTLLVSVLFLNKKGKQLWHSLV